MEQDATGFVGRAPQRPNSVLGQGLELLGGSSMIAAQVVGRRMFVGSIWEGISPCLGPKDCVRLRTAAME